MSAKDDLLFEGKLSENYPTGPSCDIYDNVVCMGGGVRGVDENLSFQHI